MPAALSVANKAVFIIYIGTIVINTANLFTFQNAPILARSSNLSGIADI